jgi:hypothetical protein
MKQPSHAVGPARPAARRASGWAAYAVCAVMAVGLLATPTSMHSDAARWHLLLWDPWWVLGGALFVAAAWSFSRDRRGAPA